MNNSEPVKAVCGEQMSNPFENESSLYRVLVNEEGQHSLWPQFIAIPSGWTTTYGADSRAACLQFINNNWTDMRPNSLIKKMDDLIDVADEE
jgi:MbtH protein